MQPTVSTPISLFILLTLLSGWFISDFRLSDVVEVAVIPSNRNKISNEDKTQMAPAASSPNIETNWYSGNTSNMSYQLPSAQARNDDKDEYVAQGRILGDSFGSDGTL